MKEKIIKNRNLKLVILVLLMILTKVPNIYEPLWNEREADMLLVSKYIAEGATLFIDIYASLSPLSYVLFEIAIFSSKYSLLTAKILMIIFNIGSLILLFKFVSKHFGQNCAFASSLIYTLILATPIFGANIAASEHFATFFILFGINWISNKKHAYFAHFLFSIAILFDFKAIFLYLAFMLFRIFTTEKRTMAEFLKATFVFLVPITLFLLSLIYQESIFQFFTISLSRITAIIKPEEPTLGFYFFGNTLLARIVIASFITIVTLIMYYKKKFEKITFFLILLLTWSIFSSLYDQSGDMNNMIMFFPFASIAVAFILLRPSMIKLALVATMFLSFTSLFFSGTPPANLGTLRYYINFAKYSTGKQDTVGYINTFGKNAYRSYKLNSYLSQNYPGEKNIFVWTENPWIYLLSDLELPASKSLKSSDSMRRFGETKSRLIGDMTELFIIDSNCSSKDQFVEFVESQNFIKTKEVEGYEIYSSNKV